MIIWSLSSSEAVQAKIKDSYKQARHDDDLNQPLSVQPWGRDGLKRRYWLIEGLDDTHFRLYRESNPALKNISWWSVAGSIPELQTIAEKLGQEKSTHSKKLSERITNSIPRFESSEDVCFVPCLFFLTGMSISCSFTLLIRRAMVLETETTRLQNCTQGRIYSTGTRILSLRRPHPREKAQVHVF